METKWYTGTGDDGFTGVLGRERVPKYARRPEAYGTVDEAWMKGCKRFHVCLCVVWRL